MQVDVKRVEGSKSKYFNGFYLLPSWIHAGNENWVPWFLGDIKELVDKKHPLFEHTSGEFLVATRDDKVVGRFFVFENARYNQTHEMKSAHFYFFDSVDDREVADRLLQAAVDWAKGRNLELLFGPMGLGGVTGGGLLIEGFKHRAAMTMMMYNQPYYRRLIEDFGFEKYIDNYSFYLPATARLPSDLREPVDALLQEGKFRVLEFHSKKELAKVADDVGDLFIATLGDHAGNYFLSEKEVARLKKNLIQIANPELIKVIAHEQKVIGFLLGFHDLSAAIQKSKGRLNPLSMYRLMREYKKSDWLLINGLGILPEYQGSGANLLLYAEVENALLKYTQFKHLEMVQIQETTAKMLSNIKTLEGKTHKIHRMYQLPL
jgi:GNAT superfamily N-acetyltransferase